MFPLNAGNRRTVFLPFITFLLFQQAVPLPSETNSRLNSSSIDFSESPDTDSRVDSDVLWLEEADRLMAELTSLDVRMYTLISNVGNDESRKRLIEQRSLNRRLICDLLIARNDVIQRMVENRQNPASL